MDVPPGVTVVSVAGPSCVVAAGGLHCWGSAFAFTDRPECEWTKSRPPADTCVEPRAVRGLPAIVDVDGRCAVSHDGFVYCAGSGESGQLGEPITTRCGLPDPICAPVPLRVGGVERVVRVASTSWGSCAIHANGALTCWGDAPFTGVGTGTESCSARPESCTPPTVLLIDAPILDVSLGYGSCALSTRGAAYCWGSTGSRFASPTPRRMSNLPAVQQIEVGGTHVCVRQDGVVSCWGDNDAGQLGDGTTQATDTPKRVDGLPPIVEVRLGLRTSCARTADDQVWCWGVNQNGVVYGERGNAVPTPRRVLGPGLSWE